jgi:exopolysaccharide biosynthesis operon protein EpsL
MARGALCGVRVTLGGLSSTDTPKRRNAGARPPYRDPGFGVFFFLLGAALAPAGTAHALWDDRLELYAAHAAYRDDNVLRLAPGLEASADTYRVSALGLRLDAPLGRQRLRGALAANSVHYDRFGQFDLDGHEGSALWEWQAGGDLRGRLGLAQRKALASLANVQDGVQSTVPNALTTRRALAAADYGLAARWRIELEGSRLEQANAAEARRPNDLVLDRGAASLHYVSRAGNRLGLRARLARGTLPNAQPVAGLLVDNSYRQREAALVADWRPGAHTRLRAHLGRVQRDYDALPQRGFAGGTGELALEWTPTGKLELTALAQRDISDIEEIHVSFVLAERVALAAKYRPSGKTELSALLETSDRRYLGEAAQVLESVPARRERVNAAGLAASYRPHPRITLNLSLRRETRSTNLAFGDYAVNVASLGARIGF